MTAGTILFACVVLLFMVAAFFMPHYRKFHVTVMVSAITIDIFFPFYLYMTRDWWTFLVEDGEILNTLVWMHLIAAFTLYGLYYLQVQTARKLLKNAADDEEARKGLRSDHRSQGVGILVVKALLILMGAGLAIDPAI